MTFDFLGSMNLGGILVWQSGSPAEKGWETVIYSIVGRGRVTGGSQLDPNTI